MAHVGVVGGAEARRVDGATGERRDRSVGVAALAHTARLGDVDHHGEKPSAQGGSALEVVDALEQCDPRFLDHLFGDLGAGHVSTGHPQHRGCVLVDELGEGGFVAVTQRGGQRCSGHHAHGSRSTVFGIG